MDFEPSARAADLTARVRAFIDHEVAPVEEEYHAQIRGIRESGGDSWQPLPLVDGLRAEARLRGLCWWCLQGAVTLRRQAVLLAQRLGRLQDWPVSVVR